MEANWKSVVRDKKESLTREDSGIALSRSNGVTIIDGKDTSSLSSSTNIATHTTAEKIGDNECMDVPFPGVKLTTMAAFDIPFPGIRLSTSERRGVNVSPSVARAKRDGTAPSPSQSVRKWTPASVVPFPGVHLSTVEGKESQDSVPSNTKEEEDVPFPGVKLHQQPSPPASPLHGWLVKFGPKAAVNRRKKRYFVLVGSIF